MYYDNVSPSLVHAFLDAGATIHADNTYTDNILTVYLSRVRPDPAVIDVLIGAGLTQEELWKAYENSGQVVGDYLAAYFKQRIP